MWHFGLCDLAGVPIGEINNAQERTLSLRLNGLGRASVQMRLDNPLVKEIEDRDGDVLLKVYQGSTLRFIGDPASDDAIGEDQKGSYAANFVSVERILAHRLCRQASPSYDPTGIVFATTDRAQIVKSLIDRANDVNDTGIRTGTLATLQAIAMESFDYKPIAEVITEMAESPLFEFDPPVGLSVLDQFSDGVWGTSGTRVPGSGGVTGYSAIGGWYDPGGWNGTSATGGFIRDATEIIRNVTDSSVFWGDFSYLATEVNGDIIVQCDVKIDSGPFTSCYQAVMARAKGGSPSTSVLTNGQRPTGAVLAGAQPLSDGAFLTVHKIVNGTWTEIARFAPVSLDPAGIWPVLYSLRLRVLSDGSYAVWWWPAGTTPGQPLIVGQDDDLATGSPSGIGTSGKVGIYDAGNQPFGRRYKTFYAFVPPAPGGIENFEFDFAPVEPTVDTVAGRPGLQLARLDISSQIGTYKPNVVFEYGTGNRTITRFQKSRNREGLANVIYALGSGTDTRVATASNADSITARRMWEDVVSPDFPDYGHRQAYIKKLVRVRGVALEKLEFDTTQTAAVFGTDYIIGDIVSARGKDNGVVLFNVVADSTVEGSGIRVFGIDLIIRDEKETLTPVLSPE